MCFNHPWAPQASAANHGSVLDSEHGGYPQMAVPSQNGGNNSPGDLAHNDSAFDIIIALFFDIIIALKYHIMLDLACLKNKSVGRSVITPPAP